ncbi:TetR family transcriptional regulator [Sphaerisporangium rufum]|uniref:TetR family transcriptional regulator n=1 Tax=Sphaerisporangium rufum TaxID=1381558 RepID=A0A919V6W9_9ACTN|nr:TetR/AcrR family transcriptional regulator C-terminal domain-containing protein [Sphaerisporangium rufum]GII79770.1 TetR family transcriptional regulator [Sphaerisporangium rufum]
MAEQRESRRGGLTRALVVTTALRLLDEVGLDGLTVRRLAAELGVQSPALYWHIRTKQELLDEMADSIVLSAGMGPPRAGESWQQWLIRRARAYRGALLAHRDGARLVAHAGTLGDATIKLFDEELTALVRHGFTPGLALRTITTVGQYTTGFVQQEQAERGRPPEPPAERMATLTGLLDGGPDATVFTALREAGSPLGEEAFEHGLRVIVTGTAAALHPSGR